MPSGEPSRARRRPSWCGCPGSTGAGSAQHSTPAPAAVVVPSATGVADAVAAARASRYPPLGDRSWGPFPPLWGGTAPSVTAANAAVRCLVMVETVGALEAVDDMAGTAGVDGLLVGPLDLALALGTAVDDLLGDRGPGNPVGRVVEAARRHGVLVAAFAGSPRNAALLRRHGIQCLAVTTDTAVVAEGVPARTGAERTVLGADDG